MTITSSKRKLRQRYLALRSAIDPAAYHRSSWRICERLLELPEVRQSETVLSYWPLTDRREVDIRPLNRWLLNGVGRLLLPVITPSDAPEAREVMVARRLLRESDLVRRKWNLMEPSYGAAMLPVDIDLVLVPAVAVDRRGNRLGYGKAFYDRFLRESEAYTIGIVFDICAPERLPAEKHDVLLHARITEKRIDRFLYVQPDP